MAIEIKGTLDVSPDETEALKSGYLLKKTMVGRCPKKNDYLLVFENDGGIDNSITCIIYHKEMIGCGVPKAYRVIFGKFPG